jgi:hypothetical protein
MAKRVFILGAGASKSHTNQQSPGIREFFDASKKLKEEEIANLGGIFKFREESVGRGFLETDVEPDIEELYTHLDIEIERANWPSTVLKREQLLTLIRRVLMLPFPTTNEYDDFVKHVIQPQDTVITFNWDILLDDIFGRKEILPKSNEDPCLNKPEGERQQYYNFVSDLSGIAEARMDRITGSQPYTKWEGNKGYYLKLHGSVDWFFCENEACRASYEVYPLRNPLVRPFCGECHEQMAGLIIPPTLNKTYRKYPLIRTLWNIAEKEISIADEIIIWGYSLPPTDFHASWLLRQARRAPLKKLVLINPAIWVAIPNGKEFNTSFVKRFCGGVRDPSSNVIEVYDNFGEYRSGKTYMGVSIKSLSDNGRDISSIPRSDRLMIFLSISPRSDEVKSKNVEPHYARGKGRNGL